MRMTLVTIACVLGGCSLIANPLERHTFDLPPDAGLVDGGMDAGEGDAGQSDAGGGDAGLSDAGPSDAGPTPAAPRLRHPWNGFRTGSARTGTYEPPRNALRPVFLWEEVPDADRYEIEVSAACAVETRSTCEFVGAITGMTTETAWTPGSNLAVSATPPMGSTYTWRVRACAGVCGDWSGVRYLHVGRLAGDLNGDGYGNIGVGSRYFDGAELAQGIVHVYNGSETGAVASPIELSNPSPPMLGQFGWEMASGGDLNGDGFSDLVVGAYGQDQVFVYFGLDGGPSTAPDLTLANPLELVASAFGWAITTGADFNGDGFDDLVVGAQSHDSPTNAEGAVFVYLGGADGLGTPIVIDSPSRQELGQFGFSLDTSDLDGDGFPDLVVGAPSFDDTVADQGIVYVFRGRAGGIETTPHWTLEHPEPALAGQFGRTVAFGDIDGDGFGDIVAGAPFSSDGAVDAGSVWVFRGGPGASPGPGLPVSRPTTEAGSYFGDWIAFVADLNGDGFGDAAIGGPAFDSPSDDEGLVVVLFGGSSLGEATMTPRLILPPDARAGAWFGGSVAGSDINADGLSDLIIGAPLFADVGAVYVIGGAVSGIGGVLGTRIDSATGQAGARFGWGIAR